MNVQAVSFDLYQRNVSYDKTPSATSSKVLGVISASTPLDGGEFASSFNLSNILLAVNPTSDHHLAFRTSGSSVSVNKGHATSSRFFLTECHVLLSFNSFTRGHYSNEQ